MTDATMRPASAAAPPVLEVRGLCAHYGRIEALRGIDLTVGAGQLVALVGANGAGKTTLLRSISGVLRATAGSVHYLGEDVTGASPRRRVKLGICQVPEGRHVFGPMSVEDNLRLGAFVHGGGSEGLERIYELFPVLHEKRALPAGNLSGGQQQMLAIGRALMGRPRLLLLDEPSMGLSPLLVEEVFRVIVRLARSGTTTLLVEQNAQAALSVADTAYVLETGRVAMSGTGSALLRDERVRHAYLGM